MVVAAYGLILPEALLNAMAHGAVNIHASLLPRWRGAAPIQRAVLAGDLETGISIMKMDKGLDTGPVIASESIPIAAEDDTGSLHDKLAALGAKMIVAALEDLTSGQALALPQSEPLATYARKIEKEETVLDWSLPADAPSGLFGHRLGRQQSWATNPLKCGAHMRATSVASPVSCWGSTMVRWLSVAVAQHSGFLKFSAPAGDASRQPSFFAVAP
jgi:hypothetical protein